MKFIPYSRYRKLILVCVNEREERVCCKRRGSDRLFDKLKARVKETYPFVRVTKTKCLGHCLAGPTVVIMPDNVWLGEVREEDVEEIVRMCR